MEDKSTSTVDILANLAREYVQKYNELVQAVNTAQPEHALHQLRLRAELTTERFRTVQQVLLSNLEKEKQEDSEETYRAIITLCRCFDEMRILFQFLQEHFSKDGV